MLKLRGPHRRIMQGSGLFIRTRTIYTSNTGCQSNTSVMTIIEDGLWSINGFSNATVVSARAMYLKHLAHPPFLHRHREHTTSCSRSRAPS